MPTIYDIPLRLSPSEMDAFHILLLNLLEADLSQFSGNDGLLPTPTAIHAKTAVQKAIEAISEFGVRNERGIYRANSPT